MRDGQDRLRDRMHDHDRRARTLDRKLDARAGRDPEQKELDRREREARRDWDARPKARTEFSRSYGQVEHADWEATEKRSAEARGERAGKDFAVEHSLPHPERGGVRYDFVDLRRGRIVDHKPLRDGERPELVARRYETQRQRHVEAYEAKYGKKPETYEYDFYPATDGMWGTGRRT